MNQLLPLADIQLHNARICKLRYDQRVMYALLADDGLPAYETMLCERCLPLGRDYAREQASQSDDVDPLGNFVELGEDFVCVICGYPLPAL